MRHTGRRRALPRRPRFAVACLAAAAVLSGGCAQAVEITPVGRVELPPPAETSVVVDAGGRVLAELHTEQDRDLVPLERVPQHLRAAVVAIEDVRFYHHAGVDGRAIARAFRENAREGRVTQGGSTITQQLAKNALDRHEQTLERKLEEASIALQLEAQFSKEEILEQYLNTVYFGHGAYGVQTAARRYFGVDVEEVTLPQAALLAALLKSPSTYDPYADPEAARGRRDLVLRVMRRHGLLDDERAAAAEAAPLGVAPPPDGPTYEAPYFVSHVLEQLQHAEDFAVLGDDPVSRADRLFRGGLRIETTLDPGWQEAAELAVAETVGEPGDPSAAMVALDPGSGEVRALVGGRDYDDADDPVARFNLATKGRRQPGSTFKSLVLAAALSQGHTLDEVYDAPAEIEIPPRPPEEPEPWVVRNFEDTDFGELTLAEATTYSVNAVYAQLVEQVGPPAVAALAEAAGVRRPLPPLRALALGAAEVTPMEMASVQATLAAGGVYREPSVVTRITGPDGEALWERGEPEGERVLDEAVAWLLTGALADVVSEGTGDRADLRRPMAGKTGTSQEGADAWFTGYTPDMAAAVWIGFPEARVPMTPPRTRVRVRGGNWPAELFARFGLRALAGTPARDFPVPEVALETVRVDVTRHCLPNPYTPPELVEERSYLTGTAPDEVCREPTGPPTTDVPDTVGLPLEAARRLLHGAGFVVEEREQHSTSYPPGIVARQDPPAGSDQTLDEGYVATVYVAVAGNLRRVEVPDVLNEPLDGGVTTLEDAGFLVEVVEACPGGAEECTGARQRPGTVWEQSPDAGASAPRASVVRVSAYPSPD